MLKVTKLKKILGKKEILKDIDLTLEPGVIGLLGANGAGKTTLIRCLTGIYDLDGGEITYNGEKIAKSKVFRQQLGYLPQSYGMFRELTVYEMLDYFCALKKVPRDERAAMITECLRKVNLEERINDRVGTLSGGMIRRVGIAQSLLGDARVIVLDEPTSGLDPQERARFKGILARINDHNQMVLLSTHIVEDIESVCDRVIVMHEGRVLFEGTCQELTEKARGRVYTLLTREAQRVRGDFYEVRVEKNSSRLVCREVQDFTAEEPTMEDGYMAVMKGFA